jgi:hypothetical protein
MGYKTKSMINAKGAYAGGNVDPGYDSAAYLKTNLKDSGGQLGNLSGKLINKKKGILPPNGDNSSVTPDLNQGIVEIPIVDNPNININKNNKNIANKDLEPTLTGKNRANEILESLDYNKKSGLGGDGLKMMGGNDKKGFREAFDSNRTAGKKEFKYEGKMYNTKTAEDVAEKLTSSQLKSAENKSVNDATKYRFKSKSKNEIAESYIKEGQYRMGDKLEAMGLNPMIYSDRMKGNFLGSAYSIKRPNKPTGDGFSKGMLRKNKYNK